jgi:hypothetical protein
LDFGGEKPACIYAWTHMKEKNKMEKESKKVITLQHCYGILRTRGKEEAREVGITFASTIICSGDGEIVFSSRLSKIKT